MENTFKNIVNSAKIVSCKGKSELDLGLDEALTYAYIMTHTSPSNYFYIRFFDWENVDEGQHGFRKNIFRNKSLSDILKILNISDKTKSYFESVENSGNYKYGCRGQDYLMLPTLTTRPQDSEHISSLIITELFSNKPRLLSFDTMGTEDLLSHVKKGFFEGLDTEPLQNEKIQGFSGCSFYTAYFFEECLMKNNIQEILESLKETIEKMSKNFNDLILNKDQVSIPATGQEKKKNIKGGYDLLNHIGEESDNENHASTLNYLSEIISPSKLKNTKNINQSFSINEIKFYNGRNKFKRSKSC